MVDEAQFRGKQGRLTFAYLVSERAAPRTREDLAALLWPEEMPDSWAAAISAVVSSLRGTLSHGTLVARGVTLSSGLGLVRLELPPNTWVDIEAGGTALDLAESTLRSGRPDQLLGPSTVAANITRRPFLSGIDGEWVESRRRRLKRQLVRALECLTTMWLSKGEPALAIETALEAVALDSYRERGYELLMRAHAGDGNLGEVARTYDRLKVLLMDDLGTSPSNSTLRVARELLA